MTHFTQGTLSVGVLHPGQMGAAIAAQVRGAGHRVVWLPAGRSKNTRDRAEAAELVPQASLTELCREADIVISICPPAHAEDVAHQLTRCGFDGIYVEANAISPSRFERIRRGLPQAEAVIDACIIGPPPTVDRQATLYLAGPERAASRVVGAFQGTAVRTVFLEQEPPAASALKMAYASYQKASRALAAVAHALADEYDVTQALLTEAERNPRSPLSDPDYLPSVASRAWRWAPELRDVAQTLSNAGLPDNLASAAADVLERWAEDKDVRNLSLAETLQRLRKRSTTAEQ